MQHKVVITFTYILNKIAVKKKKKKFKMQIMKTKYIEFFTV